MQVAEPLEAPEKRPVGRPKGLPKTGGRKPKSGNRVPEELRRFINQRGRPLELLAAIADGRMVSAADPQNPGKKLRVYPSLSDRVIAARVLLGKVLPDLKSTELTGPNGAPLDMGQDAISTFDLARRMAFVLAQGVEIADQQAEAATRQIDTAEPAVLPPPPDRSDWTEGQAVVSFAELLPGDRERWVIRDQAGRVVGSAIGREQAADMARRLGEAE